MYDVMVESLRKAAEFTSQTQMELYKKWLGTWPGFGPSQPVGADQVLRFQKKWAEVTEELVKRRREFFQAQFDAGLRTLDSVFRLAEAKDLEGLRAKTVELWQKSFECLQQAYETQVRDFQTAVTKWTEPVLKGAA